MEGQPPTPASGIPAAPGSTRQQVQKEQEVGVPGCQGGPGADRSPVPHQEQCCPGSCIPHPASQIPPPLPAAGRSSPDPFPSHPQGSVSLSSETFSDLDHEKQVQSLSLAASPSLSQDTHVGDRSRLPTQSPDPGVFLLPGQVGLIEVTPEEASHDCLIFPPQPLSFKVTEIAL